MKDWKTVMLVVVALIALGLMFIFGVQSSQNKAIDLEETVETAMSDIKVQEKRRYDLIPNLVDCVKQYDKHEAETLQAIVDGRSGNSDDATMEEVQLAINAISEAYPELKSNENYKELMNELSMTENLIAEHRKTYNNTIKEYNKYVRKFPARIFLDITGYEVKEFQRLEFENSSVDAPSNLFG